MANRQAAIAQFIDVTGASKEAAAFFLDSSGGDVDAAVDQFFATGGEFEAAGDGVEEEDELEPPPELHVPPVAAPGGGARPCVLRRLPEPPSHACSILMLGFKIVTQKSWGCNGPVLLLFLLLSPRLSPACDTTSQA